MHESSNTVFWGRATFVPASRSAMLLTRLIRYCGQKVKQSLETVSEDQSYLLELLLVLLLIGLVILGIGWM
ncbi:hypothetical protein GCM10027299_07720 [Larkinella ripae]